MSEERKIPVPPPLPDEKAIADVQRKQHQLKQLESLKQECLNLFKEFEDLFGKGKQIHKCIHDSGINVQNLYIPEEIARFNAWRTRFESAIEKARGLPGIIEADFWTKYQTYNTWEQWENDPVWQKLFLYYKTAAQHQLDYLELEKFISEIKDSQDKRYAGYEKVGTHPAAIVCTGGALPLLIFLLYLIDLAITAIRVLFNGYQKSSAEKKRNEAISRIESQNPKSRLYFQAAFMNHPFFQPIKEAAESAKVEPGLLNEDQVLQADQVNLNPIKLTSVPSITTTSQLDADDNPAKKMMEEFEVRFAKAKAESDIKGEIWWLQEENNFLETAIAGLKDSITQIEDAAKMVKEMGETTNLPPISSVIKCHQINQEYRDKLLSYKKAYRQSVKVEEIIDEQTLEQQLGTVTRYHQKLKGEYENLSQLWESKIAEANNEINNNRLKRNQSPSTFIDSWINQHVAENLYYQRHGEHYQPNEGVVIEEISSDEGKILLIKN